MTQNLALELLRSIKRVEAKVRQILPDRAITTFVAWGLRCCASKSGKPYKSRLNELLHQWTYPHFRHDERSVAIKDNGDDKNNDVTGVNLYGQCGEVTWILGDAVDEAIAGLTTECQLCFPAGNGTLCRKYL